MEKQLFEKRKLQIEAFQEPEKTFDWISKRLGRSKGGIVDFMAKRLNKAPKKRSGGPKKLTERDKRQIGRKASNTTKFAVSIKRELGLEMSRSTV